MGLSNDLSCEAGSLSCCPGLRSLLHSPPFVRFICANVGLQGLLVVRLPVPFVPHSASLSPATATRVLSTPVPVSAPPTSLDECLFCVSLVLDLLALRFSVSSGCARRRSVSTYAAILVLPKKTFKRWGDGSRQLSIYLSIYLSSVLSISHLSIYVSICIRYSIILEQHFYSFKYVTLKYLQVRTKMAA